MSKVCQDQENGILCLWFSLRPMIFLCSANELETFINNSKPLVKAADYVHFEPWLKTGFLTSKHEKWRSRHRLITPSFHDTRLLYSSTIIFNEQSFILARRFDKYAKQPNQTHDLYSYISACTLDIIAQAATGTNLNAQSGDEKNEFVDATIRVREIISMRIQTTWLWSDFIINHLPVGREQKNTLKVLHGFSRKIIKEHLSSFNAEKVANSDDKKNTRRLAFLDSLLTQMHNEKLTLDGIQEEVDTFMFEGHDTTAAAISFCCYLVGSHPDVQEKIHAEMHSIFGDDRKRQCTIEDIQKTTYFDCVIKVVRLFEIHHDTNVYPNLEIFDPAGFAESSLTSNERSPFTFIPFSAGSRNCIGQRFAGLEEKVILSTLFRRFSFRSTQSMDELHLAPDIILRARVPIQMYSQLRKEYRNISLIPISPIPLVGNALCVDKRPNVFFELLCRTAKESQDQDKGAFCFWYLLWPTVFLSSSKGLETFINTTKQLSKSFDYVILEPWLKTGLLTSNGAKWRSRRRLITPSFHDTRLLHSFMIIFNEQACILARRFDEYAKQPGQSHNLYPYISACTLDIIAQAATGTHPKAQSGDENNEFVQATVRISEIIFTRSRSPWLWPNFTFNMLPIGREQKKVLKVLHGFSRKIIEERLAAFNAEKVANSDDKKSTRRLAFLDSLLTQMHNEKLTLDDIQEEVDTFMFEGHDTTAAAISFCCYLVGSHPDVQAKIHAEMDSIFGDDEERECTMEDIQNMTYLDCVIKESLRIFPSVPAIGREVQEDFIYHGQTIRKGTMVMIFLYAIHHDASVYPNPEKFDPERFASSSSTSNERSPFAYIPFSAGSRNCIGQRFAGLEERVILSTLFRRFSFQSTQSIKELELSTPLILRPEVPIQMIIKRR